MSCVAVDPLHLSVEQREPVHRVVAGRGPSNLSTKVFTIFGEGEGPYLRRCENTHDDNRIERIMEK